MSHLGCTSIEPIWAGHPAVVLGGGPSLTADVTEAARGLRTIAVNTAFRFAPWADVLFWGDWRWFIHYREELQGFLGMRVTFHDNLYEGPDVAGIVYVFRGESRGLSTDRARVNWNLNTGAGAINLAYHLGARDIILLGFDMQPVGGRSNFHQDYSPATGLVSAEAPAFRSYRARFDELARDLRDRHVKVVNATPGSALAAFPIEEPYEALAEAKAKEARVA